jgi:hypothetical protein
MLILFTGCIIQPKKESEEKQSLQFTHAKHIQYFLTGNHKDEYVKWHLEILDENEAPEELVEGKCLECHDSFEDLPGCGSCHFIFQEEKIRDNRDQRPCFGCHRTAWSGFLAGIPTIQVCKSCHSEEQRTISEHESKLRKYIERDEDIPWIRTDPMVDHVHFSHVAHTRFAAISCKSCHPEKMGMMLAPSEKALKFSMNSCIECHEQNNVQNDCLVCHK